MYSIQCACTPHSASTAQTYTTCTEPIILTQQTLTQHHITSHNQMHETPLQSHYIAYSTLFMRAAFTKALFYDQLSCYNMATAFECRLVNFHRWSCDLWFALGIKKGNTKNVCSLYKIGLSRNTEVYIESTCLKKNVFLQHLNDCMHYNFDGQGDSFSIFKIIQSLKYWEYF